MSDFDPIPNKTRRLIERRLSEIERQSGFAILFACESGSRAWGFASPDSDFDIRFIYARDRSWYLSVEENRDVFETPIEDRVEGLLDIGGWDVRKTLRLARKSNPVIWEWLQSPIVYRHMGPEMLEKFRKSLDPFFSPISACHHYGAICKGTMDRELSGHSVRIKKYFYMLRPILAAIWIERLKTIPPMEFKPLLSMLDDRPGVAAAVDSLLTQKAQTDEKVAIKRVELIDNYLDSEMLRLNKVAPKLPKSEAHISVLDDLFRSVLASVQDLGLAN